MSDVTFENHSGSGLTLILPDTWQDSFANGNIRSYTEIGNYAIKDGPDPIISFTYNFKGSQSTDISGIAIGGRITFKNRSGYPVIVVFPNGQGDLANGEDRFYTTVPGTYIIQDLARNPIFSVQYEKGTVATTIYSITSNY
ncbi:hypothetical protein F5148DRAFT_1279934 [Russula earlei]|uniref:Uncharacterized protein n=1 Tax=Russula earlei TaxID=71964 RepID=A0ACC0UL28_9AGAM|nr:hypothetical protein F5148DRAFT_1279934 [Russula earlei]